MCAHQAPRARSAGCHYQRPGVDRTDHSGDTRAHGAPHAFRHHMSPTLSADMVGHHRCGRGVRHPRVPRISATAIGLCASSPQGNHDAHHQQAFHTSHTMRRQRFAVLPRHPTKRLPHCQILNPCPLPPCQRSLPAPATYPLLPPKRARADSVPELLSSSLHTPGLPPPHVRTLAVDSVMLTAEPTWMS